MNVYPLYHYRCEVCSVYDGDTLRVDIDLGFDVWVRNVPLRLAGVDTPEIRGVSDEEKARGRASRDALRQLLAQADVITVITRGRGKYGRWIADLHVEFGGVTLCVNHWLIAEGLAEPYMEDVHHDDIFSGMME